MSVELDLSRAPLGQIAAARLVEAVAAGDDRLERHYLEVKSDLDLTKKTDVAKIAKYILGSANRLPDIAATAFEGYGVMVIGVAPGSARGVPPIEALEISKIVSQYLGASGPHWDVVRVPVEGSSNEVLVIVVDPPRDGQKPFPCRKDGDGLVDGRIYIRADGETREAKGDELDRLLERGAAQIAPDVAFEVTIDGAAHLINVDVTQTIEAQIDRATRQLLNALPKPEPKSHLDGQPPAKVTFKVPPANSTSASIASEIASARLAETAARVAELAKSQSSLISSMLHTDPEERTEEQYRDSIIKWEQRFREKWPSAVDALAGHVLEGITIRVKNATKTFFHDVEVKIHLEGPVRGVNYFDDDHVRRSDLDLPTPPRIWGPVSRPLFDPTHFPSHGVYLPDSRIIQSSYRSPLNWRNTGSVDLRLSVGELRPREEYVFDEQEFVLVLPGGYDASSVNGTWEITARDHNEIYSGTLELQVGEVVDLTASLRKLLDLT